MGPSLETVGISKHFGPVIANDNLNVVFDGGKIYAVLGENGAGKTTFLNILAGIYRPDRGKIIVNGEECHFRSPKDALNKGIFLVQQSFSLIDNFTVAENLALLRGASLSRLDLDEVIEKLGVFSRQFGQKINPSTVVSKLPLYFRQLVEIQKGLIFGAKVLLLDEPTSVLGPQEVEELSTILRSLVSEGKTVVLTSHKLNQVMKISNDFTVMRRGQVVFHGSATEIKHAGELIRHMFGDEITATLPNKNGTKAGLILRISQLKVNDARGRTLVDEASLQLESGQILGLAGVSGNGQKELAQAIAGLVKPTSGKITFKGTDSTGVSPALLRRNGLGYIPEEGSIIGAVPDFTLPENFMLTKYDTDGSSVMLDTSSMGEALDSVIAEFGITPPDKNLAVRYLSGGNLQKMLVGRELSRNLDLLICYNPTKGLDLKTTTLVHKKLAEKRNQGCAILLISEDLDELKALSDTIAVMFEGRIVGIKGADSLNIEEVGRMMSGR